jgi:hypothetical protein
MRDGKLIKTLPGSARQYADTTVWPATSYSYAVQAEGDKGESETSRPVTVTTMAPPIADARLEGHFGISAIVQSSSLSDVHPGKPLGSFHISFRPRCDTGPCGGRWTYFYISQSGGFHAANHGHFKAFGHGYLAGLVGASLSWCSISGRKLLGHHDSAQFQIHMVAAVTDAQGQWIATKIAGTGTEYDPSENGCFAGHLAYKLQGKLLRD